MVRFALEVVNITYYDKIHWVLIAFFLIKPIEHSSKTEGEIENEIVL